MAETVVAGKYRILRRLAAGGMGEVCLAAQMGPAGYERVVALKRMLPTLAVDRELLKLFLDEARLIALLNHRNICQIIELGEDPEGYFVAMEMVNGPSVHALLERLRKGVVLLDPFYAIDIAAQVAEALSYAYTAPGRDGQPLKIIHRDVTPHNVLLSTSGDVKLIDFGVAKSSQQQHSTESGTVKGKMGYLSPEQSMGRPLDGRSDLFSLGIMLYEMVTLNNPFARADMMAMVRCIQLEDVPPLSSINPGWAPFDPVVQRLLAKLPEHRFPDAQTAAEALQDLRPLFPRPAKRLGVFVSDHFGSDLQELAKSLSMSEARQELEGTFRSGGAVVVPGASSPNGVDAKVEAARASPTLYISGPKGPAVQAGTPSGRAPPATRVEPSPAIGSDSAVVRKAMPSSPVPKMLLGVGGLGLAVAGVYFGVPALRGEKPAVAIAAPPPIVVTPPVAPPPSPPPAALAPTPAPPAVVTAPPVAPTPAPEPVEAAEVHHKHGKHSHGEEAAAAPTPAPAPPSVAEGPSLGTLNVSGLGAQVLRQARGHLDVQSGQYKVGVDYSVAGGQLHAKLSTTPWAIVSVNGAASGQTKSGPIDLGTLGGGTPLRVELDHPDIDHAKLVMTFKGP